jgi:glucose-1-phosphate thymidylyltransferase
MKGIILAGGSGTRLQPLTKVTSKQLLPIYDQPMIYYPLKTLLNAGITEILIIVAPDHAGEFLKLLGSGKELGAKFTYEIQDKPEGLAQAFVIGETFIGEDDVTMILGANFFENDLPAQIKSFASGGKICAKPVPDPERFGVVWFDDRGKATKVIEKPEHPDSNYCITGLYIFDNRVVKIAKNLKPSARGELEITDVIREYMQTGSLRVEVVDGRWIDAGTFDSLFAAGKMIAELKNKGTNKL